MDPENQQPTPPSEVNIRTMESDIKAAPAEVIQVPETTNQLPAPGVVISEEVSKPRKKVLWAIVIALGAVAFGLVGYFVLYPFILPPKAIAPVAEEKEEAPLPIVKAHKSYFVKSPAAVYRINLLDISLLNIAVALQDESTRVLPPGSIKEVELLDEIDGQISLSSYLMQFGPPLVGDEIDSWFEDDFTAYLYYDENGAWPGYLAKIKEGVNIDQLKAGMARQLETGDLTVFYVTPPGVMGQFKDGKVNSYATRYSVGSRPGAAFNYGYFGDYLIISTSYNGLKAALSLLGP